MNETYEEQQIKFKKMENNNENRELKFKKINKAKLVELYFFI